jgi:hypothetical protein
MGALGEGSKIASGVVEGLKTQPLALALVVINIAFLIVGSFALHGIADEVRANNARDASLIAELSRQCGTAHSP